MKMSIVPAGSPCVRGMFYARRVSMHFRFNQTYTCASLLSIRDIEHSYSLALEM